MTVTTVRWECGYCGENFAEADLLRAPNPFDPTDVIRGCPDCQAIEDFYQLCDVSGCHARVSCGTSTPDGYRHTCGPHRPTPKRSVAAFMMARRGSTQTKGSDDRPR